MLVVVLKHRTPNDIRPLPADIYSLYQTAIEGSASHAGSEEMVPLLTALATANMQAGRIELTSSEVSAALQPSAAQLALWDRLEAADRLPMLKTVETDRGLLCGGSGGGTASWGGVDSSRQCTYQLQHLSLQEALSARAIVETRGELIAWSDPDAAQAFITDPFNTNLLRIGGGTLGSVLGGCRPVWSFEGDLANVNALHLLPDNREVRSLSIQSSDVNDEAVQPLAACLQRNQATVLGLLELGDNDIGVVGAGTLARALETNTSLTALSLAYNRIENAGAIKLATSLAMNKKLRSLDLYSNSIGSQGVSALADTLASAPRTAIAELNLGGNSIGEEGLASLSEALAVNTSLAELSLRSSGIDDEGLGQVQRL